MSATSQKTGVNLTQFTVLNMTMSHGPVRSDVCIPLFLLRAFPHTPLLNSSPSPYEGSTCDSKEEKMDVEGAQRLFQCCPASKVEATTNQTTRKVRPHRASETMIPAIPNLLPYGFPLFWKWSLALEARSHFPSFPTTLETLWCLVSDAVGAEDISG